MTRNEPEMTHNEPEMTCNKPGMTRNEPTARDTPTEDAPTEMCTLQMKAIPLRVGAKMPTNLSKAGAPREFYAPAALAIPQIGATRVALGLHAILPTATEIVLHTRANFQCRGLTVNNPGLGVVHELTTMVTNASLYRSSTQRTSTPAYYWSPTAVPGDRACRGEVVVSGSTDKPYNE